MNDLQKSLDQAFRALSAIHVCGDEVEVMAAAREYLRTAYRLAETGKGGEDDG